MAPGLGLGGDRPSRAGGEVQVSPMVIAVHGSWMMSDDADDDAMLTVWCLPWAGARRQQAGGGPKENEDLPRSLSMSLSLSLSRRAW